MNKQVNPIMLVAVGVLLLALLSFFAFRTLSPPAPAYTISPPSADADGATAKRANYMKAHNGQPPPGAAAAGKDDNRQ